MISFYPGPSKVWDALPRYLQDAWESGILSVNHRSPQFANLWQELVNQLHLKLEIPGNYVVLPASSATECWEIIAQSLLGQGAKSLHLYNGAFGEKWMEYTQKLTGAANNLPFLQDELPDISTLKGKHYHLIALTHNETSNGTALPDAFMHNLRQRYPHRLIAADATSSMAAVNVPWAAADIWYASAQKGFGLPAGLAILVCSPKAIAAAELKGENRHYNSLLFMLENARKQQTTHTPNVMNLYLLLRSLQDRAGQTQVGRLLEQRWQDWLQFWQQTERFQLLVKDPALQSKTVLCLTGDPPDISQLKADALEAGLYLGNGYGPWKNSSFRIANFPAHSDEDIGQLRQFLQGWLKD